MKKPTARSRTPILDFDECKEYIGYKLGYDIRDTLDSSSKDETVEYRDWWHFLIDNVSIDNPCDIEIGSGLLEYGNDWQNEITRAFINEFGDNAEYHAWW